MTALIVLPPKVLTDNNPVGDHTPNTDRGSERGSGYWFTNPILRHCDTLFATYQGYDPGTQKWIGFVRTNQIGTGVWSTPVALPDPATVSGQAADQHGGAAIIADKSGFLHLLYGSHNTPMIEAVSVNRWDASAFNATVVATGPWNQTTYPSLVRDSVGRLHMVYRGRNNSDEWRLVYQRGTTSTTNGHTTWGPPRVLASTAQGTTDTTQYSIYDSSIAVASGGTQNVLHVAYQMYKDTTGSARAWGYLRSNNGGTTWRNWQGGVIPPTGVDNSAGNALHLVESSQFMDVRLANIAIGPNSEPWVSVLYLAHPARPVLGGYDTKLWRLSGGQWSVVPLSQFILGTFGPSWRVAFASISFDAQGVLYVAAECLDMNDPDSSIEKAWGGITKEVAVLMSTDLGQTFTVYPVSAPDNPKRPHWLANIERPTTIAPIPVPALLYTDGFPLVQNQGGTPSDVVFVPLYKY